MGVAATRTSPLPDGLTPADWRQDLRALATDLPRHHVNAFHTQSRVDFDQRVADLDARLVALDADHVYVGFAGIAASVGDGRTGLHLRSNWQRYAVVPAWFGCRAGSAEPCELRITAAAPGFGRALGARLLKINDVAAEEVRRRLGTIASQGESDGAMWASCTSLLQFPNVLHGLDVVRDAAQSTFEFDDAEGGHFVLEMPTVPQPSLVGTCLGGVPRRA